MTLDMDKIVTKTVNGAKIVACKAAKTASDAASYTKTQIEKAAIRDQIKDQYRELGKLVYEGVSVKNADNNGTKTSIEKLDELFSTLNVLENNSNK
ncbi:MAG: hypothetical protein LBM93_00520, partial [Oscillospiraceae bacterium]|jgi:uncharacterized protein with PhoU and TrkA domain|nr:hypothetical protein [Oscillospiraceae bacterium]